MYFIQRSWFLKCSEEIHYVPIGDGDMWYYVPVDDGWEEVLGRHVYIMSQYFSPNAKYWTASSRNWTRAPLIECGRSTIELWNLYIIWVCIRPSTSLQMPNIELHRPGIEPGPPLIECGRSTIELWNLYIIWMCLRPSTSLQMQNIELHRPGIEPGPHLIECGHPWAMESVHNMGVLVS